jgi:asparagine synthetase B (glutamine-hydrolysing)
MPDEICISPSLVTLIRRGAPTALDEAALAVFLRAGFFLGEDTPFQAIRALPPNVTFEWQDGHLHIEGRWALVGPKALSRPEAIDAYITLFRGSIERRLSPEGRFIMPLSGGQDSRHILLEPLEQGQRPDRCVTVRHFVPGSDDDARLAHELCGVLRLSHVILDRRAPAFAPRYGRTS